MKRLLLLLVLVAALLRSRGIDQPWSKGDHNGWGGAFYSNIARNYCRYGYRETRLAPVVTTGETPPEKRRYYLTHPPAIGLAVSLSFHLFGEHEWSARLVPLLFSLGNILLLYRLGSVLASREMGIVSAALLTFVPAETIYGAHVDPQGPPVAFFGLLLLLAYIQKRPILAAFALALGASFDWPIHYLSGLLAFHALVFDRSRRLWAGGLVAGSVALVLGFFLYARAVAPRPEQQYLQSPVSDAFLFWTGIHVTRGRIPGRRIDAPSLAEWLPRMARYFDSLFSFPLLALAALGAAVFDGQGRRSYLGLLLSFGLLHVLLFPVGAYVHDYWSIYLAPGLALAGAAGLSWIADRLPRRTVTLASLSTALSAFLLTAGLHRLETATFEPVTLGKKLHELTTPEEGILSLYPVDVRDAYYADRRIEDGVNRVSLFEDALGEGTRYRYFVVPEFVYRERPDKPLFQVVRACCERYAYEGYYLFDLKPLTLPPQ